MPVGGERETAEGRSWESVVGDGLTWLSRWTLRWLVVGLGAVALGWVVKELWSILLPVVLALVLTTVLEPPARWMETRLRFPPGLAAAATILAGLGLLALVVLFVAPSVGSELETIADNAAGGLDTIEDWLGDSGLDVSQDQVDAVVDALSDRLQSSASTIASGVLVGVSAVTSALVNLLVTLVLAFFFVKDGRRFLPWLRRWTGPTVGGHLGEVAGRMWTTLSGFVRTQALVGLIDAVLIGLGLVVVGVPLALPLSILTFVAAFAPIIGAVTIGALAVLVALVSQGLVAALVVLAIVLVVQQLEGNVFLPWLQGRTLNLHAAVVLLTVVLGSTLFGVVGAFLGVPLVAVAAVAARYVAEQVAARSGGAADRGEGSPDHDPDPDAGEVDASSDSSS